MASPSEALKSWWDRIYVSRVPLFFVVVLAGITATSLCYLMSDRQSLRDCSPNGKFHVLGFADPEAVSSKHFVAVKVDIKSERDLFTFEEAIQHCRSLNAQVWSVIHGQPEWEGVHNFTKQAYPNSGAWLQVSSMVECTNGQDECLHAQALEGQGLGVVWPPDSFLSSYSRLIGGNSRYRCLVVSESPPYVWKRVSCTDRYHALCIQRQCQWKPPP